MADQSLENKAALVAGGSRGIGAAIAKRLAHEGAQVAITYASKPEKADEVVKHIEAGGGSALAIKADGADEKEIQAAVSQTAKAFGKIYASGDEIAAFVAFIAGPESAYITGANLMIDGGFSA